MCKIIINYIQLIYCDQITSYQQRLTLAALSFCLYELNQVFLWFTERCCRLLLTHEYEYSGFLTPWLTEKHCAFFELIFLKAELMLKLLFSITSESNLVFLKHPAHCSEMVHKAVRLSQIWKEKCTLEYFSVSFFSQNKNWTSSYIIRMFVKQTLQKLNRL